MSELSSTARSFTAISTTTAALAFAGMSGVTAPIYEDHAQSVHSNSNVVSFTTGFNLPSGSRSANSDGLNLYADSLTIKKHIETINTFSRLKSGWDGHDGEPPSQQAIVDAITLLKRTSNTPPTRVGISNDGEICLIWEKPRLFSDFGVYGDGTFSYFIEANRKKLYGDELKLSDGIPKDALNLLA